MEEIGKDDIDVNINLRLALLVHKKIQINRRKLKDSALSFIDAILDHFDSIPTEIKYVVQVYI